MSSECERVFSQAKKMITDERNRLNADIIEVQECCKSWSTKGLTSKIATTAALLAVEVSEAI